MEVTADVLASWHGQASVEHEPAKRCESCRHLQPLPLAPNGARVGPDGVCRLVGIEIDRPLRRVCGGWQTLMFDRRQKAIAPQPDPKAKPPRWLTEARDELAKRAPSIKRLRRLLGEGGA